MLNCLVEEDAVPEELIVEDHEQVRLLRLNRPQARNALSSELVVALHAALHAADGDPTVEAIVLTGSDPAFCAGVDLKEAAARGAAYFDVFTDADCVSAVGRLATPVIGAVNGAAFTGGLELALGCDFLIASERASFADTHVRVGVLPGGGMTVRLPRAVGSQRARRMSMTGEVLDAAEALRVGLVTEVVAHAQLVPRALELAAAVVGVPPELLRPLKQMYAASDDSGLSQGLVEERHLAASTPIDHALLEQRRVALMSRNRGADQNAER
jgi:enoyl-CoA hydratase/carnithine racemase